MIFMYLNITLWTWTHVQHSTPEARRLAPVGSRSQANLWDWVKVQILCLYSITSTQSATDSSILIKMIKIYIFAMAATKIKSLQSNKRSNFEGQNIRQFRLIYKSSQCTKPQTTSFGCTGFVSYIWRCEYYDGK